MTDQTISELSHMGSLTTAITSLLAEAAGLPEPISMTVFGILGGSVHDAVTLHFAPVEASTEAIAQSAIRFGGVIGSWTDDLNGVPTRWVRTKANGYRKSPDASDHLDRQAQVWRTLLDGDTDLDGLRHRTSFLRGVAAGLSVVQVMRAQLVVLTGFTVLLAWGAWMLSHQQEHGFLGAIATAVGAIGVTGSALIAGPRPRRST